MTDHDDTPGSPELVLERRQPPLPPPALRGRVLAAVDDMLAGSPPVPVVTADGMAWVVAATVMTGLLVAPWLVAATRGPFVPQSMPVSSLAGRALAAGVPADVLPPVDSPSSFVRLASSPPHVDDGGLAARRFDLFRIRRLLEGEL